MTSLAKTVQYTMYRTEPGLMFVSRMKHKERQISQGVLLNSNHEMKNYNLAEKAGVMALQTLVGFSRYKEELKGTESEIGENGARIYPQKISTLTHGVNLKTLQMIEDLGYIKIDSMQSQKKQNVINKIRGREPEIKKQLLIAEKIGFKRYDDIKKMTLAMLKGDKDTIEAMKKTMQKVTFRLTDKPIDFEELYKKSGNLDEIEDKKEKRALKRLAIIFDNQQGILKTKHIDITKDRFGRDIIHYNAKESFGQRVERNRNTQKESFYERLTKGVNQTEIEKRAMEQMNQKEKEERKEEKGRENEIEGNL